VLAALIIHAVWHMIAARKLKQIRLVSKVEFWFGVVALLGVLLIDVLQGMIIGLFASLVFVIYRSSRPHISILGRVPGIPGAYSDLMRHPENIPVPGVMIFRLDGPIYYANALTVRDHVKAMIAASDPPPQAVIFDAGAQDQIDLTSIDVLRGLIRELQARAIVVCMADVHAPVREFAARAGMVELITKDQVFGTVDLAVHFVEKNPPQL
jgi:MFS superfamily sulfate permease-like transporter